jgi:glutamate synthase (NADPH/NADH) small chain
MGELRAFLDIHRGPTPQRDPGTRTADYAEVYGLLEEKEAADQGARCMECGVPFCHSGCPLGNLIPDWNDLVYRGRWREAIDQLHATNDFPEWTGRICPAPCEAACVLAINDDSVTIKQIENAIVERAFAEGWITPRATQPRTGRKVAVIGSGPAGLAAAAQLNLAGHSVTVYERDEAPGGLMRFGVPDFKLEKRFIDRRVALLEQEGIRFEYNVDVGVDVASDELGADAVVVCTGARVPRELPLPGRDLEGVHWAMDYLYVRNRWVAKQVSPARHPPSSGAFGDVTTITAADKHVVVIGGGDTAMDCVANAHREQAKSVTLIDTYKAPGGIHTRDIAPWPEMPRRLASTYAMDEGGDRMFQRTATELIGENGHVVRITGAQAGPGPDYPPVPGTHFELPADLVLIAIGFSGPERAGPIEQLALKLDARGNIAAPAFETSRPGVFAAGDARRGQSLIVWAIAEGRRAARVADRYLTTVNA